MSAPVGVSKRHSPWAGSNWKFDYAIQNTRESLSREVEWTEAWSVELTKTGKKKSYSNDKKDTIKPHRKILHTLLSRFFFIVQLKVTVCFHAKNQAEREFFEFSGRQKGLKKCNSCLSQFLLFLLASQVLVASQLVTEAKKGSFMKCNKNMANYTTKHEAEREKFVCVQKQN